MNGHVSNNAGRSPSMLKFILREKNLRVNHQSVKRFGPRKGQTKCQPDLDPYLDLKSLQM